MIWVESGTGLLFSEKNALPLIAMVLCGKNRGGLTSAELILSQLSQGQFCVTRYRLIVSWSAGPFSLCSAGTSLYRSRLLTVAAVSVSSNKSRLVIQAVKWPATGFPFLSASWISASAFSLVEYVLLASCIFRA